MNRRRTALRGFAAFVICWSSLPLYGAGKVVTVSGRRLQVNGQPFAVEGVDYSPIPVGSTAGSPGNGCSGPFLWWADRSTYIADFPLIKRLGANTLRAYAILNDTSPNTIALVRAALDAAQAQGLNVIMNYYPDHFADPSNPAQQAAWQAGFVAGVNAYKDHPAVLIWEFANENNLDNGQYVGWYPFVETVAAAAKSADPTHPIMTVEGETQSIPFTVGSVARQADDAHMTNLDIWGVNAYRGTSFQGLFEALASSTSKSILVAEFGKDAYHDSTAQEDQAMQASYINSQWQEISARLSASDPTKPLAGGVAFEWTDEWWKDFGGTSCNTHDTQVLFTRSGDTVDPNYQNEWFGLAAVSPVNAITNPAGTNRSLRKSYTTLQSFWNPGAAGQGSGGPTNFFSDTVRNYPNPFRIGIEATTFVALVNEAGTFDIRIYDAGGQFVTSFSQDTTGAGRSTVSWDGHNRQGAFVSPGLYFAKIHGHSPTHDETQYRRVVGVK